MNILQPDTNSKVYKQFITMIKAKAGIAEVWLINHKIDYIWNYHIGNHLYRIYIPCKDLLLDFEYYPVNNIEYNYIRINYDTDIIDLLETIFPENMIDTQELTPYKLKQRAANRFLRENSASPVYDRDVLRLALVKNQTIYQCMIIKNNKVIANVTKQNCSIPYGTYILFRYLTEMFGFEELLIRECMNNSYTNTLYQVLNMSIVSQTSKKKIWWNPIETKWHIKREDTNKYIPFYLCEQRIYKYKSATPR